MRIFTDFDSGAMAAVEEHADGVFDLWPYRAGEYGRDLVLEPRRPHDREPGASGAGDNANFAFHFKIDGCRGRKATLRFHVREIKEGSGTSAVYANPDFPVWSPDGESWQRMPRKSVQDDPDVAGGRIVVVEQEFDAEPAWVSYQYPYSNDRLTAWLARALRSRSCMVQTCGTSTEGRDVRVISITDPATSGARRSIWLTGIQHCAETGAGWGIEGFMDFLLSTDPLALRARREYVLRAVPIVNVDAVAEGRGRLHPRNLNLNREWEKPEPAAEVAAIRGEMDRCVARGDTVELFLDIHGFSTIADRNWVILPVAAGSLPGSAQVHAEQLQRSLCGSLPFRVAPSPQAGYAAGMAARRFGAAAFSIDGYVFRWPTMGIAPDLSSHYEQGCQVWPLADIRAAGAVLAKAVFAALLDRPSGKP